MKDFNHNMVCGSRLDSDPIELKNNIIVLSSKIDEIMSDDIQELYYKHNMFTSYCVLMLLYSTGHRPVRDMFCFREDLDLEENILLINDKISSDANKNRVCWFSDTAKDQIKEYFLHLSALSQEIYSKNNNVVLASIIQSLKNKVTARKQPAPLFFFLDKNMKIINIDGARLFDQVKSIWKYVVPNHNRHTLENNLHRQGIPRTLIDMQTGHQQIHFHLNGQNTSWSAFECSKILTPALNTLMQDQGWSIIEGITSSKNHITPHKVSINKEEMGYIRRETNRIIDSKKVKHRVKEIALNEIKNAGGIENYVSHLSSQKDTLKKMLSECEGAEKLSQKSISFYISIINEEAKKEKVRQIKKLYIQEEESSPFSDRWLSHYSKARKIRSNFVSYLVNRTEQVKQPSVEMSWAEVIVSSILIGGMFNEDWALYILKAGPKKIEKITKWIYFIDVWETENDQDIRKSKYSSPLWRWQPDAFTRNLIRCLLERKYNSLRININEVENNITDIVKTISFNKKTTNNIKYLCGEMDSYWAYHYPYFITSIFKSKTKTTPLAKSALARLVYQRKISVDIKSEPRDKRIFLSTKESDNKNNLKEYLSLIRAGLRTVILTNKTSDKKQLEDLKNYIINIHEKYSFSDLACALSQWTIHMCVHVPQINKISSINTYFNYIATPLTELIGEDEIEDFTDEEISNIYHRIIHIKETGTIPSDRANQLFNFNNILIEYDFSDFTDLNWNAIAGKYLTSRDVHVDANIITITEYEKCLELITISTYSENTKSWMALFIIFGFRYGLRISEVNRLRKQDVQISTEKIILQVQKTQEGRTKTYAGIRQVPNLGELNKIERDYIKYHINDMEGSPINTPLFLEPNNRKKLLSRDIIWEHLHSLFFLVTGDKRVRFQHLRHSFSTCQFIHNMKNNEHLKSNKDYNRQHLLYKDKISTTLIHSQPSKAYICASLSTAIGHKNTATSFHSYIHLIDHVAVEYANEAPLPDISLKELSMLTRYTESSLKKRMQKYNIRISNYSAIEVLKSIQIGDAIKKYKIKNERWPNKIKVKSNNRNITLIDIYDILYSYGMERRSTESIAFRKSISEEKILNIINIAKSIEEQTNYLEFGLYGQNKDRIIKTKNRSSINSINKQKTVTYKLINSIDSIFTSEKTKEILYNGTKAWLNSTQMHERGYVLIFKPTQELRNFLKACILCGYDANNFKGACSNKISANNKVKTKNFLNSIGITKFRTEKIRNLTNGVGEERHNFIQLTLAGNIQSDLPHELPSLNQLFFILSIKFNINS